MIKYGERSATGGPSLLEKLFSVLSERKRIREEAKKIAEKKRREETIKDKYYAVARLFNALHCHTGDDLWMCPICNKIHPVDREKKPRSGVGVPGFIIQSAAASRPATGFFTTCMQPLGMS